MARSKQVAFINPRVFVKLVYSENLFNKNLFTEFMFMLVNAIEDRKSADDNNKYFIFLPSSVSKENRGISEPPFSSSDAV